MEYRVVITKMDDARWSAIAPGLPHCEVEAPTRDQAIEQIKDRILQTAQNTEIVKIEFPGLSLGVPGSVSSTPGSSGSIWDSFGISRDDPTLDEFFDEIERRRDQLMVIAGQIVEVTQNPDQSWRAIVTAYPDCEVVAGTRGEVLDRIEQRITESLPREEDACAEVSLASD